MICLMDKVLFTRFKVMEERKITRKEEALTLENTSLDLSLILKVPPTSWSRESFITMRGKVDRTVETVSVFASILLL